MNSESFTCLVRYYDARFYVLLSLLVNFSSFYLVSYTSNVCGLTSDVVWILNSEFYQPSPLHDQSNYCPNSRHRPVRLVHSQGQRDRPHPFSTSHYPRVRFGMGDGC